MSLQPLLHLVATQPHLLVDHVEAYAALVDEEMGEAISYWKSRTLMNAIALLLLIVGVILGGVAAMLWMVVPISHTTPVWGLIVIPVTPLSVALLCLLVRPRAPSSMFADLKGQLATDLRMLRRVSSPVREPAP